jgi:acyl dehydratase
MKPISNGEVYRHEFRFTQDEVNQFAKVTGDNNPVHWDADFAAGTIFKRPIMHGMLGAAVFSRVLGTLFPGPGTIYMKQHIQFMKPMYVDTDYVAVFTVKEIIPGKSRAIIETKLIEKSSEAECTIGEATVMNTEFIPK